MSNTSKGKASKGSHYWMQEFVNERTDALNEKINLGTITWLSPLKKEYKEYRLGEKAAKELLNELNGLDINSFWPSNGPQWDAIGKTEKGDIVLVEAKAHTSEITSACSATKQNSLLRIKESIANIFQFNMSDDDPLLKKYYQIANRYVFLDQIQAHLQKEGKNCYLIFIYFTNDNTYKPTKQESFETALKKACEKLILKKDLKPYRIFIDVTEQAK